MNYGADEFSLGLRARNLVISDWKNWGYIISQKMDVSSKGRDDSVEILLIRASLEYINILEVVQEQRRKSFD